MKRFVLILALCSPLFAQDYKIDEYVNTLNVKFERMHNYCKQLIDYRASIMNLPSTTRNDLEYSIANDFNYLTEMIETYTEVMVIILSIYKEISNDEDKKNINRFIIYMTKVSLIKVDSAINQLNTGIAKSQRYFLISIGKNIKKDAKEISNCINSIKSNF